MNPGTLELGKWADNFVIREMGPPRRPRFLIKLKGMDDAG